ncbi:glycosyltransferase family 4 protein [Azospirillum sp. YIM B02556]|uniref:Glycosyltransferase family 4 protein n=1 Tax=Azospirillum endophyticum TaxID=2800326 RepID=A0ABS1FDX4_9PROT|nr:glycosyltransferase family 4 protein [Azospirillum endophyticum]MBK1841640.1 glycosyltransferase family 4 protein [Azospirillum endophyticum]
MFVNRVFPPHRGATGRCLSDLVGRIAKAGWRVTVVSDGPRFDCESDGHDILPGVTLCRTGGAVTEGDRPDVRAYLDSLCRLTGRALRQPRHDLVVTMTDPPLLALAGPVLAARHGAASLHWCQDLYPDLLPVLGVRMPAMLRRLAGHGMAQALRRHDGVAVIGRCMRERVIAAGMEEDRVTLLPNWPDPAIRPFPQDGNGFRRSLGLEAGDGRFLVVHSGTLGLAHPMDGALDAAARLQDSDPAVLFLVVGEGKGIAALEEAARQRGLRNLRRLPWQPGDRLAECLSAADLHLVAMDPAAEGMLVPSKLAGVQAAGRPCLFLGPQGSEAAARVGGCGLVVDPFDGAAIAEAVRAYAADRDRCVAEGRRAARLAAAWTADRAAVAFAGLAERLVTDRRAVRPAMGKPLPYA